MLVLPALLNDFFSLFALISASIFLLACMQKNVMSVQVTVLVGLVVFSPSLI